MNEEEIIKKAVFYLKDLENDKEHLIIEQRQAITTILNLIEKQQKEIEKKDKIIDKMAELIEECRSNGCIESEEIDISEIAGEKNIIDYFTNLVEKENK